MAGLIDDPNRNVIPHWRESRTALVSDEIAPFVKQSPKQTIVIARVEDKILDWHQNPTLSFATDLVNAAYITNDRSKEITIAANYILEQETEKSGIACRLAKYILGIRDIYKASDSVDVVTRAKHDIRVIRKRLQEEPRNAIIRVDLARAYAILGLLDKANEVMQTALILAPENRFVLRSANRLYIHRKEYIEAFNLLHRNNITKYDPWLLAAEIASGAVINRSSNNIKRAIQLLDSQSIDPKHLSELASAIGTNEACAGNNRQARKRFAQSLLKPTENAIAQAAWISRNTGLIQVSSLVYETHSAFEARAWQKFHNQQWKESVQETQKWWYEQPFSSRPLMLGTYVATVAIEDYALGAMFAKSGLVANPDDFYFKNNLSYALALDNRINDAEKVFKLVKEHHLNIDSKIVFLATSGLIALRSGNIDKGCTLYESSIKLAQSSSKRKHAAIAAINYAHEALRIGLSNVQEIVARAQILSEGMKDLDVTIIRDRLNNRIYL